MADLTIVIPAGPATRQCIPVEIVNDDLTLEAPETFSFKFETLPDGVVRGSVSVTEVIILDDDTSKLFASFFPDFLLTL